MQEKLPQLTFYGRFAITLNKQNAPVETGALNNVTLFVNN
jgi:hypothetical protein